VILLTGRSLPARRQPRHRGDRSTHYAQGTRPRGALAPRASWAGPVVMGRCAARPRPPLVLAGWAVFAAPARLQGQISAHSEWEFKYRFPFPGYFKSVSNFQNLYQIHSFAKIHETSFIILLNSRYTQEKYKTQQ
jgi:hypothetical protein